VRSKNYVPLIIHCHFVFHDSDPQVSQVLQEICNVECEPAEMCKDAARKHKKRTTT